MTDTLYMTMALVCVNEYIYIRCAVDVVENYRCMSFSASYLCHLYAFIHLYTFIHVCAMQLT